MRRSPLEIARSHVCLPVRADFNALKHVLRDWHVYSEVSPLQSRPTFPAALCIEITRPSPSSFADAASDPNEKSNKNRNHTSLWQRASSTLLRGGGNTNQDDSGRAAPHVHRALVPLEVWTALLPWEVQRGLSFSELRLPPPGDLDALSDSKKQPLADQVKLKGNDNNNKEDEEDEDSDAAAAKTPLPVPRPVALDTEEFDPYGVVFRSGDMSLPPSTATSAASQTSVVCPPSQGESSSSSSSDNNSNNNISNGMGMGGAVPGMLFVMDAVKTAKMGGQLSFWSGAIAQPIDVCFIAPTQPEALERSEMWRKLHQQTLSMRVADNKISPAVLERYFPDAELQAVTTEFRVHTYGHLDPFPNCQQQQQQQQGNGHDDGKQQGCYSVQAQYNSRSPNSHVPRYVLESVRHVLRDGVRAALQQSLTSYTEVHGKAAAARVADDTANTGIGLTLEMGDALIADLMAKAQLCTQYVSSLEENIEHHLQVLNTPVSPSDATGGAAAAAPLPDDGSEHLSHNNTNTRRMEVWLSETERVYMTAAELAEYQAKMMRENAETPWEAAERAAAEEEEAAHARNMEEEGEEAILRNADQSEEDAAAIIQHRDADDQKSKTVRDELGYVQPAVPNGVDPARSISKLSRTLAEEDEARPAHLAPSFTGRHEAGALVQHAGSISADRLARYPKTSSHMPLLPPIDYELFDLCLRLGLAQERVVFYYYERMMREWKRELRELRDAARLEKSQKQQQQQPRVPHVADADVSRMIAMVRDPSLQVSGELKAIVEAVAALKGW